MNANAAIGAKVKELRIKKKFTLKQLSMACGLSIGFLSQFERGISSIALDSLEKLADVLEVPLAFLFEDGQMPKNQDPVVHGIELQPNAVSDKFYQCKLTKQNVNEAMLPQIIILMPYADGKHAPEIYSPEREKFIYVLEGVATLFLEDKQYVLYPGDSIQIHAYQQHNWENRTPRITRFLVISTFHASSDTKAQN
ncbi:MAG: XRE family transcriptional regulator [Oscillospiraceae bacterium]|nr:XRE family transcriptional regulator [Oscillospiraceae bacterium]